MLYTRYFNPAYRMSATGVLRLVKPSAGTHEPGVQMAHPDLAFPCAIYSQRVLLDCGKMKTAKIAAISGASILAVVALVLAIPAMAATNNGGSGGYPLAGTALSNTAASSSILTAPTALTVGQTITFTSTSGQYRTIGATSSAAGASGAASGTMVLTVTGAFKGGYALSLTSGSLTLVSASATSTSTSTTYTMGSGSAEMGPHQAHLVGQGTIVSSTPGAFLFAAGAHANFQGQTYNTLRLDVQVNGVEYGVLLLVTSTVA